MLTPTPRSPQPPDRGPRPPHPSPPPGAAGAITPDQVWADLPPRLQDHLRRHLLRILREVVDDGG
jgi:hypothetical protein